MKKMRILALGLVLLLVLGCTQQKAVAEAPGLDGNYVYLELEDISTTLAHYEYNHQETAIKYFAVLT